VCEYCVDEFGGDALIERVVYLDCGIGVVLLFYWCEV